MKELLHEVFEQTAATYPYRVAIEYGDRSITYSGLNSLVSKMARACLKLSQQQCVIMSLLPKGISMVFSLLAIFKSGHIYLPSGRKLGDNSWRRIFHDIQPGIVLTTVEELPFLKEIMLKMKAGPLQVIVISNDFDLNCYSFNGEDLVIQDTLLDVIPGRYPVVAPTDVAYLFFSSGTTGTPKIIAGMHKSIAHFIQWQAREFDYGLHTRASQLAAATFDASLKDILPTLITGGTLCIPEDYVLSDIDMLVRWSQYSRLTVMATVPSVFRAMLTEMEANTKEHFKFPYLKYFLLAGEQLYYKDVYRWRSLHGNETSLINLYGTTESTVLKTFYRIPEEFEAPAMSVNVGKPIADTEILIINDSGQLAQPSEEGNIYIKTPFLTKGYYNDKDATEQIFVVNPLTMAKTDVVYRTGDYGKLLPSGDLLILGRRDNQVKIRGVRIDLSAVESGILQHSGVKQVKCMVKDVVGGMASIVCYYMAEEAVTPGMLREHCTTILNAYEVPDYFIAMTAFAVNSHGKLDTQALPDPFETGELSAESDAGTTTNMERSIKTIWEGLFKRSDITPLDNFFSIGGNSLLAIQFGAIVKRKLHIELGIVGLQQLFNKPVLRDFSAYLDGLHTPSGQQKAGRIQPAPLQNDYESSFSQEQIWLACQAEEANKAYNMFQSYLIRGDLDIPVLRQSITLLTGRHEILRTAFTVKNGMLRQVIAAGVDIEKIFACKDIQKTADPGEQVQQMLSAFADMPFALSSPGVFRILIIPLNTHEYVMGVCIHHIIGDSWSAVVFARELVECYNALKNGGGWDRPALDIQYKDYACYERQELETGQLRIMEEFWTADLGEILPAVDLRTDRPRRALRQMNGERYEFKIPQELEKTLHQVARNMNISLFSILLSAYYLTLYKYSADSSIIVGMPVAIRNMEQLVDQIGPYVNVVAIRTDIDLNTSAADFMDKTFRHLLKGLEHQLYPFQRIVERYAGQHRPGHNPVFDFAINMITSGKEQDRKEITGDIVIENWDSEHRRSKYDMTLYVYDDLGAESLFLEYNTDIFDDETIRRFSRRFVAILQNIAGSPGMPVKEIIREKIVLPQL